MIYALPFQIEHWEQTTKEFDNILQSESVAEDDRVRLVRLLSSYISKAANASRIVDHFLERHRYNLNAGRRAKIERIERATTTPPVEVEL